MAVSRQARIEFGKNFRAWRKSEKMPNGKPRTQSYLAGQWEIESINISRWETGRHVPVAFKEMIEERTGLRVPEPEPPEVVAGQDELLEALAKRLTELEERVAKLEPPAHGDDVTDEDSAPVGRDVALKRAAGVASGRASDGAGRKPRH